MSPPDGGAIENDVPVRARVGRDDPPREKPEEPRCGIRCVFIYIVVTLSMSYSS